MRKRFLVASLFFASMTGSLVAQVALAQPPEQITNSIPHADVLHPPSPQDVLSTFLHDINAGNTTGALTCIDGAAQAQLPHEYLADYAQLAARANIFLSDLQIDQGEEQATAKFRVGFTGQSPFFRVSHPEQLKLRLVGKFWKIESGDPAALRLPILFSEDIPFLQTVATALAHPQAVFGEARRYQCLTNLKQLALGALQMIQDYDQKFAFKTAALYKVPDAPPGWEQWPEMARAISPYVKNRALFTCPADDENSFSYSVNPQLENVVFADIKEPSKTVLFYDGKEGQLDFHHEGRANIAFVDGHVATMSPEEAKTLIWKPGN